MPSILRTEQDRPAVAEAIVQVQTTAEKLRDDYHRLARLHVTQTAELVKAFTNEDEYVSYVTDAGRVGDDASEGRARNAILAALSQDMRNDLTHHHDRLNALKAIHEALDVASLQLLAHNAAEPVLEDELSLRSVEFKVVVQKIVDDRFPFWSSPVPPAFKDFERAWASTSQSPITGAQSKAADFLRSASSVLQAMKQTDALLNVSAPQYWTAVDFASRHTVSTQAEQADLLEDTAINLGLVARPLRVLTADTRMLTYEAISSVVLGEHGIDVATLSPTRAFSAGAAVGRAITDAPPAQAPAAAWAALRHWNRLLRFVHPDRKARHAGTNSDFDHC